MCNVGLQQLFAAGNLNIVKYEPPSFQFPKYRAITKDCNVVKATQITSDCIGDLTNISVISYYISKSFKSAVGIYRIFVKHNIATKALHI